MPKQNPISDVYFQVQDVQSYLSECYNQGARDQFVEDLAEYLQQEQGVPEEVIAEMIAESALEEVVADVIDKIENNSVSLIIEIGGGTSEMNTLGFPLYSRSPVGSIFTLQNDPIHGVAKNQNPPTDSFYTALQQVVSDDDGTGEWGNIADDVRDGLEPYEEQVFQEVTALVVEGQPTREVVWLLEFAEEKVAEE